MLLVPRSVSYRPLSAKVSPNSYLLNDELAKIPGDILQCYVNGTLWAHMQRVPFSMNTLAYVIRKLESHPGTSTWSAGQMAANIIHRYRFDGIHYDRCVDTSTGALPLRLDVKAEYPKMEMIWQLIQGSRIQVPRDALNPEDTCTLHWLLSYSVNTTLRCVHINPNFWRENLKRKK